MSNKGLILLMLLISLLVYVPILWICLKTHRSIVFFILMLLGNIGVIYHVANTMQEVANNSDPQAGMGAALYLAVSLGIFAVLVLSTILVFFLKK